ncbi:MAG: hypothetical protein Q8904_14590 [Bacteroidota bacterium]|nr:hypothetical protein [Bacteroidota bacterium]
MAISKSTTPMTGSMANVTMYKMHGSDNVIIRMKGGPTRKQIKTKPQFEKVRQNNSEWAGCTRMGSKIRKSFEAMNRLEDYPVTGALNAICKQIQKLDTGNNQGKRAIRLSQHKDMISGFSFSRKQVLESVVRVPIDISLDRTTGEARIEIPPLNADMYLYNFRNLPYYRIVANLGGVCDMMIAEGGRKYESPYDGYCDKQNGVFESEWMPAAGVQPAMQFTLQYPLTENPIPDEVTLLLCLGIEFGKVGVDNQPVAVKYAGTGKIVRVG